MELPGMETAILIRKRKVRPCFIPRPELNSTVPATVGMIATRVNLSIPNLHRSWKGNLSNSKRSDRGWTLTGNGAFREKCDRSLSTGSRPWYLIAAKEMPGEGSIGLFPPVYERNFMRRFPEARLCFLTRSGFLAKGEEVTRPAIFMEKVQFDVAVKTITNRDRRFQSDGYHFLKDALDHTIKQLRKDELIEHRHVSGPELLEGIVEFALAKFGPMALSVLESWGMREGEDIGAMVFNLIDVGAFGRSEEDAPSDFSGVMKLQDELQAPYRPTREVLVRGKQIPGLEPPARGTQPAKSNEL